MKANEFTEKQKRHHGSYGIFLPPTTNEEALEALTEHFLGSDWYSFNPVSKEQVTTEIVALIIEKTQPKKWYQRLFNL
jgi:hypothetical protein